jgi:hypothetical protein
MADAAALLDARGVPGAAAAPGAEAEQTGDIVVPLARDGTINIEGLDAEKQRLLAGAWEHGIAEGHR